MLHEDNLDPYRPADLSDWLWYCLTQLQNFARYLGKDAKDLSIDEKILFQDSSEMVNTAATVIELVVPPSPHDESLYSQGEKRVPIDSYFKEIISNYSYRYFDGLKSIYTSTYLLNLDNLALVYKTIKEKNPLFIYADPIISEYFDKTVKKFPNGLTERSLSFYRMTRLSVVAKKYRSLTNNWNIRSWTDRMSEFFHIIALPKLDDGGNAKPLDNNAIKTD